MKKETKATYYEERLECVQNLETIEAKKEFIKTNVDFSRKIKKDSDAKIVQDFKVLMSFKFKDKEEKDIRPPPEVVRKQLIVSYERIIWLLGYYCDIKEEYYSLIALWILGATTIDQFTTFPYLYFNAMKGSGKTRLMRLVCMLSGGDIVNSLTDAVLFRTTGAMGIDEFEGLGRKGQESLKELLNSAYKKGIKVKRMKKVKTPEGEEHVVEEYSVYRPIVIANIGGMDDVLGDRCIPLIIDKSDDRVITKRMEMFDSKEIEAIQCSLVSLLTLRNLYEYTLNRQPYTSNTLTTLTTYTTHTTLGELWNDYLTNKSELEGKEELPIPEYLMDFFNKIDDSEMLGRMLELAFPLLTIAFSLSEEIFDNTLKLFTQIDQEKKETDVTENYDVAILKFISEEPPTKNFQSIKEITRKFRDYLQINEEWINERWVGRSLKRVNIIMQKRRGAGGMQIILNQEKAQRKIRMYK